MREKLVTTWVLAVALATASTMPVKQALAAEGDFAYTAIHVFKKATDGPRHPSELLGVVPGSDGWLHGTSQGSGKAYWIGTAFRVSPDTGEAEVLHRFGKGVHDPNPPVGQPLEQADGHFVGVTYSGGDMDAGTVYRMHPDGWVTVLHHFTGGAQGDGSGDGAHPSGTPIAASDGWLYGVTLRGGAHDRGCVYRLGPNGEWQVLYAFRGFQQGDGKFPIGPLVQARDGRFYGVTSDGGLHDRGTLFRIASDGTYERLFDFDNGALGTSPSGLTLARDGRIYGTTAYGGDFDGGAVYRVGADGRPQLLHAFDRRVDGARPNALMAEAPDGRLYFPLWVGTWPRQNSPIVRLDPATDQVEVVARIPEHVAGGNISGRLIAGADGSLIGSTYFAGVDRIGGVVFRFVPSR